MRQRVIPHGPRRSNGTFQVYSSIRLDDRYIQVRKTVHDTFSYELSFVRLVEFDKVINVVRATEEDRSTLVDARRLDVENALRPRRSDTARLYQDV